jgi:ATP-dependent DNA ligase
VFIASAAPDCLARSLGGQVLIGNRCRRHSNSTLTNDILFCVTDKAKASFISPMLLLRTEELPEGKNWLFELKLDGMRPI